MAALGIVLLIMGQDALQENNGSVCTIGGIGPVMLVIPQRREGKVEIVELIAFFHIATGGSNVVVWLG
jgi:hypothetical protein